MIAPLRFCIALGLALASAPIAQAKAILQGTVSFLNSGSRPAAGVKISAFGANDSYTTDAGMFRLEFPDKKPGDKVKIIVGNSDRNGVALELVNDKVIAQVRIPSNPDDDIVEVIVCKVGQRNDAALKYNGLIVRTINEAMEKRLREIDEKLGAAKIDAETIVALQNEKEKLAAERDSALIKAEEQALYIASINLDKASHLVRDAVLKVDSLQDIAGAIAVLDNEMLYQAYLEASEKKRKAEAEIVQVVAGFEFKIKLLEPLYRYGEIAECYEKIAGIYEKEDYDKEKLANNLSAAASYWGLNGIYQKQVELYQKALSIREKALSADHPDVIESYTNLARTFNSLGEYQKSLEINLKNLTVYQREDPELLAALAWSYGKLAQHQKSLEFNQKSLVILEKGLPADHPRIATAYYALAWTYGEMGQFQKQLEFNLKALAIREKVLPNDHPQLAQTYNDLAFTYGQIGENQKSLEFNLKALVIREKVLPSKHPSLAQSYTNLALTYGKLGENQKRIEYNQKAVAIREQVLPGHPDLAMSYNNLAFSYGSIGQHQKALEYHQIALAIREKALSAEHPDLAKSYNNLAMTYSSLGEHQKQLEFDLKALAIREKVLPSDHPDLARSYNNLAFTYGNLGEKGKALELGLKALAINEKVLPPNHPDLAISYTNIGRAYQNAGENEKGVEYGKKAIEIGEASNPKHQFLNRFYANLGTTYLKTNHYAEAKTAFEKSESLKAETGVFRGWAMYYALQNDSARAIENLQKAISLGYKDVKWIESDETLQSIRGEQGYKDIVDKLKKG